MNTKLTLFALAVSIFLLSCNKTNIHKNDSIRISENDTISLLSQKNKYHHQTQLSNTKLKQSLVNSENKTDLEQLQTEAFRLRGGGSVKSVELEKGKATITYIKNYKEYKELNPQSRLSENDLKAYWLTGDEIQKTLVGSPARLMKMLDFINEVEINLPFENKIYQINVKKSELEKFIGKSISEISNDWVTNFADPYIYNKQGREKFFNRFVIIKGI